ncbi:type II toxin-antitoxin system HicA family toxin [Granulicella aggregans]|nr:type II toxin-antitoxin system HicA family toxin [Granulicella aggregans]
MSTHKKALRRLASSPKDFTWQELVTLMTGLSFDLVKAGGSGRKFIHPITGGTLFLHQPHPANVLKAYQVRDAIELLKREGFL